MSNSIDGKGSYNSFRDIHYLDGKLYKYNIYTKFPAEIKSKMISNLILLITKIGNNAVKEYGIKGLEIIRNDIGKHPNYSSPDNILADDILVDIHELLMNVNDNEVFKTVINHICEQMHDMIKTNGYCPQGRCTRLFEVYMFLRDYVDKVYLPKKY